MGFTLTAHRADDSYEEGRFFLVGVCRPVSSFQDNLSFAVRPVFDRVHSCLPPWITPASKNRSLGAPMRQKQIRRRDGAPARVRKQAVEEPRRRICVEVFRSVHQEALRPTRINGCGSSAAAPLREFRMSSIAGIEERFDSARGRQPSDLRIPVDVGT